MSTIEELRLQLKQAEEAASKQECEDAKSIQIEYDYHIKWEPESEYMFLCTITVSQKTKDLVNAWKAKYPKSSFPVYSLSERDIDRHQGMSYLLAPKDLLLIGVGGGSCVLRTSNKNTGWTSDSPRNITQVQADSLKNGIVPEELKNWGVKR